MPSKHQKHQRRSIRLPGYDYASPGAYFVTICVRLGECLLGAVQDTEMLLNENGRLAHDFWTQVPLHFHGVGIDAYVIMPNHLHAFVVIREEGERTSPLLEAGPSRGDKPTLGQIIAYYKHQTTRKINSIRGCAGSPIWQRNYWEHIIRSENSLDRIRRYIQDNPVRWKEDQLHPAAPPNAFNRWRDR